MPKKDAKTKRTRAKPKNVIQKVIVNVVGRGGGRKAPSGPPRPTPLQQALQFAQAFQQPRQGESLFQSAQVLQRLIDPINARLDLLMPERFGQSPNLRRPMDAERVAMPAEQQGSAFPNMEQHSKHDRQHVADLPDAQLVQPKAPLVPAGPMRMDDPHEEVPLNKVDPALVQEPERVGGESVDDGKYENAMDILTRYSEKRNRDTLSAKKARELAEQLGTKIPAKSGGKKLKAEEVKDALGTIIMRERQRMKL